MSILEYQSIDTEFDRISNSDKNEPEAIEKIKLTIKTIINDKTLSNDFKATFIWYVKKLVISKNKNPREVWKLIHNSKKFKEVVKKYGIVQVYRLKNLKKRSNWFYGKLWKSHEEQDKDILKNDSYWEFYNLRNLLVLADWVKKNWKEKNERLWWWFSASWSFWSIYLWYLLKKEKEINSWDLNQSFPLDIMIWSSSWWLYPVWYSLWREAAKINPEKVKFSIEWMMEYFPKNLDWKNLLINWEYIMNSFIISSQKLIKIINETRKSDPLPNIKNITFNDLKRNIWIIASRNRKDWSFQQILFSNWDNVLKAIMASTNPKFFLLWNLLTDVNFANNNWNDGWHTNPNPWENLWFFSPSKIFQIVWWPWMEEKISPNIEVENCNYIPKMVEKKSYTQWEDFDIETTYLRAIIWYFWKINVSNTINMINYLSESNFLSKEQKKSAIKKLISYLKSALKPWEIKENTNEAVFWKISFDTTTQDLSIIQENKYLSKNDKTEIIKAYFNPFFDFIIKYNWKDFNEKSEELKRKLPIKDSLLKDNLLSLTLYYYSISNFNQLFKENKSKLKKWLIKNDFEIPNSLKPYIDLTQYSTYKRYILWYNIPSKYITKISSLNDINSKLKDLNQIVHSYWIINPEEIDYSYYKKKFILVKKNYLKVKKYYLKIN